MTGRTATREERERGRECRGQGTKNDGEITVAGSAGYDHSSGRRDHSYSAHKIVSVGSGMGDGSAPVGSGAYIWYKQYPSGSW